MCFNCGDSSFLISFLDKIFGQITSQFISTIHFSKSSEYISSYDTTWTLFFDDIISHSGSENVAGRRSCRTCIVLQCRTQDLPCILTILFCISPAHAGAGRPCNLTQDLQDNFCVLQDTHADMRIITLPT